MIEITTVISTGINTRQFPSVSDCKLISPACIVMNSQPATNIIQMFAHNPLSLQLKYSLA